MFLGAGYSICGSLIDLCLDETEVGPDLSVMGYRPVANLLPSGGLGGTRLMMARRHKKGRKK